MRLKMTRRRRVVLGAALLCYAVFWMMGGCADHLIIYPSTERIETHGAERRIVDFEGGALEIWTARSPGALGEEPRAIVLSFIGNADRAEYVSGEVEEWGDRPVEMWRVNYPGFGGSTGPARLSRFPVAALAAYDAAAKEANGRPIFVQGMSLGTTSALYVAAHRPAAGLLLRSPPPLRQLILGKFGWWNLWLLATPVALGVPGDLDSLRNAAAVKSPAVFVLIDTDEVIPIKYQRMVASAYGGPSRQVVSESGGHNSPLARETHGRLQGELDWLWQQAGLEREGGGR